MAENNHPLAKHRRARGLSQEAMGSELGFTGQTIWRWENGKQTPRIKDAKHVSEKTGIPVADLMTGALQTEAAQ